MIGFHPSLGRAENMADCHDDMDTYHGAASARIVLDGKAYVQTWDIQVIRNSSFDPFERGGLLDRWMIKPDAFKITLADGTDDWIVARCGTPSPSDVLGVGPSTATFGQQAPIKLPPLSAGTPVTVRAPLYPNATYRPGDVCAHQASANVWADVTFTIEQRFQGPATRDRRTRYDDLGEDYPGQYMPEFECGLTAVMVATDGGQFDRAVDMLTRMIGQKVSADQEAWLFGMRSNVFLRMGRFDDSIADLERLLPRDPSDPGVNLGLANAYYKSGRPTEALPFADRSIAKLQSNEAFNLRASIEESLGRRDDAIADYREIVKSGLNANETKVAREGLVRLGATP